MSHHAATPRGYAAPTIGHFFAYDRAGSIAVYARAVRRLAETYDTCPDRFTVEKLEGRFAALVTPHSWSTAMADRNGLQFFWQHILKRDSQWVKVIIV